MFRSPSLACTGRPLPLYAFLCGLAFALLLTLRTTPVSAGSPHPLDPLSPEEIATAVAVIAASGKASRSTRAAMISLLQPGKQHVLGWTEGDPVDRRALAVLRKDGQTFEAVIDLASRILESWDHIPGAQPAILSAEWDRAQRLVKEDPRWRAAMRARDYESVDQVFCESLSAGYFGIAAEEGRRLLRMPCYDISDAHINIYAHPIEGLIATVDLDANTVVSVQDDGIVPVNAGQHEFVSDADEIQSDDAPANRETMRQQRNVSIDHRMVSWQDWSFHLGFDQRFGPVLSLISFNDGTAPRSVLYQAHISEVFVPYMEPSQAWSFRTYLDGGEYGLGALASPLVPGIDCPAGAVFVDATLSTPSGGSYVRERVLCVFERETFAPQWRHWEALNRVHRGRAATELVVRAIPSVAHYDYVMDWVFTLHGEIHVNVGATGIDAVKGVVTQHMTDPGASEATAHGALVAPGLIAINHDHYFSIRLDLDVDGPVNSFVRERVVPTALPRENRRRSLWRLEAEPVSTEGPLSSWDGPQTWHVENPTVTTALGHHPGYQIQGHGPKSLLAPDDWPQRRAAFSAHNLWLTVSQQRELYAAGAYPNQSRGNEGLPAYVDGESTVAADLVLWFTLGFRHVTRPEDWPILSTVWKGVKLRPYGFFTRNPSVDVSTSSHKDAS